MTIVKKELRTYLISFLVWSAGVGGLKSAGRCCMAQTMDTFFRLPRLSSRIFFRGSRSRALQRAAEEYL